jgi:hypothetical protein
MRISRASLLAVTLLTGHAGAFAPGQRSTVTPSHLSALTERQMQFWEDVEEGLLDIEEFYKKSDMGIDRIWGFCKRYVWL